MINKDLKGRNKKQKLYRRRFLTLILIVMFISGGMNILLPVNNDITLVVGANTEDYVLHDPISINNNEELAVAAISGIGIVNDPYILAGWNISGSLTDGISITGTTAYFKIENCWISGSNGRGIFVESVATGTAIIANNTCNNNKYDGISLDSSEFSTVVNNSCINNGDDGIYLYHSGSSYIFNNSCSDNNDSGIYVYYSGSSIVTNNSCSYNEEEGIYLYFSGYSTINNNKCNNNGEEGIYLSVSDYSIVNNNSFLNNGLVIEGYSKIQFLSHTIEDNVVNGLPLGYFENLTDISINDLYGQLILVNCNNTIVENQNYSNTSIGIALLSCFDCQLIGNTCNNNTKNVYTLIMLILRT